MTIGKIYCAKLIYENYKQMKKKRLEMEKQMEKQMEEKVRLQLLSCGEDYINGSKKNKERKKRYDYNYLAVVKIILTVPRKTNANQKYSG